jgi:uncharacterized membrane protein YedE/YeeE
MDWILEPWPWYVGGPAIVFVMFLLIFSGKEFGVSSNLRVMCSIIGGGKTCDFFDFDWKAQTWNLIFALGTVVGGFVAATYLTNDAPIALNPETVSALEGFGIANAGESFLPLEIFGWEQLGTLRGFIMMVVGGFLVGFGARYAGGCTSGHAISGLSNLQLPSLVAVIGFFIGGLFVTYFVLPYLLTL